MAADETVKIEFDLDTGTVKPALKTTETSFKTSGKKSGKKFSESFSSSIKGLTGNLFNLKTAILSIGTAIGAAFATGKLIQAANIQEDAVKGLNTALQISGKYTKEASQELQDYAASLQLTTAVGDEVILKSQALIQSLGGLETKGLKRATQASLDLSAALGIDLQSAATLVGKAAAGEVGSFSRYGVIVKKAATNTETFARALDAIENKFGGAAAANAQTFSKRLDAVNNSFGDLQEELGFTITKNEQVAGGLVALRKLFDRLIVYVNGNREALGNLVSNGFTAVIKGAASVISGIGEMIKFFKTASAAIDDYTSKLANREQEGIFAKSIQKAMDNGKNVLAQKLMEQRDIFAKSYEQEGLQRDLNLQTSLSKIDEFIKEVTNVSKDLGKAFTIKPTVDTTAINGGDTGEGIFSSLSIGFTSASDKISASLNNITDKTKKAQTATVLASKGMSSAYKQLGAAAFKSLAGGVAGGFAAMGKAIVNGGNVLDEFMKAFLGSIGQMAVQQGAAFILQGIGYQFVPGMQGIGSGLIAAGAGLSLFGGALSALSGGGSSSTASATGAGSTPTIDQTDTSVLDETIEQQSTLTVNIQGDVLDSEETGLRITNLLNDAIAGQGVTINKRAFA